VVVQILIDAGADVNHEAEFASWSALGSAITYEEYEIGRLLIAAGAEATIDQAVVVGDLETVSSLVAEGADIHAEYGNWGETLLHKAARLGYEEIAEFLLAEGVDVNAKTPIDSRGKTVYRGGQTALHLAASEGHVGMAELFIAHGAAPDEPDGLGRTPLHEAAECGHADMVALLLAHGADLNARTTSGSRFYWPDESPGWTPLRYAAAMDYADVVDLLLAHATDADLTDVDLYDPLYEAVSYGHTDIVERLVTAGAVPNQTILDLAVENGFADVVALLGGDANDPALVGNGPYTIIVTDEGNVRGFLHWEMVRFEGIWIPTEADLEGLQQNLKTHLTELASASERWIERDLIRVYLRVYDRRYSGFTQDNRKYIVCCMDLFDFSEDELPGNSFSIISDGGCGIVIIVFDAETGAVVSIACHGCA